jgi:hypothetical protein
VGRRLYPYYSPDRIRHRCVVGCPEVGGIASDDDQLWLPDLRMKSGLSLISVAFNASVNYYVYDPLTLASIKMKCAINDMGLAI